MDKPVKLSDVVDAMEMQGDEIVAYLDRRTGRIIMVRTDMGPERAAKETGEDVADLRRIEDGDPNYVGLPDRFEIDEYDMMRDFARSVEEPGLSDELLRAISGSGAFRRFKDAVYRRGIEKQWFDFRDESYNRIARDWCDLNKVPFTED
jgi:hypothetical protein